MYVICITGASGVIMGIRLIEELLKAGNNVGGIVSDSASRIINHEVFKNNESPSTLTEILTIRNCKNIDRFREFANNDFFTPVASGTGRFNAVIVIPCSMKTLAGIASGYAETLVNRAVDVALKEGRKCILVPRETPLNLIHLENLLKAKQAGCEILLPVPSFYTFPETVDDVIDVIVGKVLNLLNIEHKLFKNWSGV